MRKPYVPGESGAQPVEFHVVRRWVNTTGSGFLDGVEVHHPGKGQGPAAGEPNQRHEDAHRHQGDAQVGADGGGMDEQMEKMFIALVGAAIIIVRQRQRQ